MTTISENELGISHDDFWEELYKEIPIPLQPGEKTIPMMIEELGRHCEHGTMDIKVKKWVAEGKLIFVGIRMTDSGRLSKAYRKA